MINTTKLKDDVIEAGAPLAHGTPRTTWACDNSGGAVRKGVCEISIYKSGIFLAVRKKEKFL